MTTIPTNLEKKVYPKKEKENNIGIPDSCKKNRIHNNEKTICSVLDKDIPIIYSTNPAYNKNNFNLFINDIEYDKFKKMCLYNWQERVPFLFKTTKKELETCKTDYIRAYKKMYDDYKKRFDECKQNGTTEEKCKIEIKNESQAGGLIDDKYYKKYLKYKNKYIQLKKMN
jgi:hypothetical protein